MTKLRPIGNPIRLPSGDIAPLSSALRAGDQLFISGQIAFEPDGSVNRGDVAVQTQLCLAHIDRILVDAGLQKTDVARVGIWLTKESDYGEFNMAYAEYFGGHRPARTCVVSNLVLPEALVEIDAIAFFDS